MSGGVTFFMACVIVILAAVVLYQRFLYRKGIQAKLKEISRKLSDILENDSDEQIMVFTDNKALMELCGQINRLLLDRKKIKSDFIRQEISSKKMLSNISHDIKTPLTVILGHLEIMRLNQADNREIRKVEAKAEQVMELINQFFTLAKLEAGDTNLEISKVNISELCRENILGFYDILQGEDFTVEIAIPENDMFIQGEKGAVNRILSNLISNGVRYGSEGKYLGLSLREDEAWAYIDIMDKGRGIEKEFAQNVFERLYTMEDSRNRRIQGNGLGLTIAKNLAGQLGGDIFLESKPGIKTTFTVKLKKFC
ncbi:MAG: HAMP domain-containing histidine kinase [Lachnospiraceae bacterium]|jgi:signal transduction histidine kinase|nr:HAMP domain-containing histidine kinase [Lachnospiraceae bacterium]GFI15737.1 sensor histidine kinase WalK [Lachnospiraceae bacterium]